MKTYEVDINARLPNLKVWVEADDADQALALGQERAREVIERQLPDHRKGTFRYEAVRARETSPSEALDA